jgi:sRNA-binding regulator protein Hfq
MEKSDSKPKQSPAEQTFQEVQYLRRLIQNETPVRVRLRNNEEYSGTIEFYDSHFIRLTRSEGPNLFVYKHDIKYLYEEGS